MVKWNRKSILYLFISVFMLLFALLGFQKYEKDLLEEAFSNILEEQKDQKGQAFQVQLPYLEQGSYSIEMEYKVESEMEPEKNAASGEAVHELQVKLPNAITEKNEAGVTLVSVKLPEQSGAKAESNVAEFSLKESAYGVEITVFDREGSLQIEKMTLKAEGIIFTDYLFLAAVCFVLLMVVQNIREEALSGTVITICGIALLSCLPCFSEGIFDGHDVQYHLARIEGVYQGMLRGEIPLRLNSVQFNGYGYLSGMMYPQLFLYFPALLRLCGVSLMASYKCFLFLISLGTAAAAYWSVGRILHSRAAGLWAAFLYTLAPYRLLDLYTRGALGEVLAMAFFPIVFYGLYEVLWGSSEKWYILALGLTGVMQSHVLSVGMAGIFILLTGILWLITVRDGKRILAGLAAGIKAAVLFLGLNLFFFVPFLYYSRAQLWIYRIKYPLHDTGAYFSQIFNPLIHAGGENLGLGSTQGEMSYGIGLVFVIGIFLFAVLCMKKRKEFQASVKLGWFCLAMGLLGCFMASEFFPWEQLQKAALLNTLFSAIQFAWRFLGIASFFLSVLTALVLAETEGQKRMAQLVQFVVLLVVMVTMLYYYHSVSVTEPVLPDKMAVNGTDMTDYLYLYGPIEETEFTRAGASVQCVGGSEAVFSEYHRQGTQISVTVEVKSYQENSWLVFPLYSYWGYEAVIDNGQAVEAGTIGSKVAVPLPQNGGQVEVRFVPHFSFRAADLISALTFAGMLGIGYRRHRKRMAGKALRR